jgi:hypothetical protein
LRLFCFNGSGRILLALEIRFDVFLAMLRFDQHNKLAELGYQNIMGKRGAQ